MGSSTCLLTIWAGSHDSLLSLAEYCTWIFFSCLIVQACLCSCCLASMKALCWQRPFGWGAGPISSVLIMIQVVLQETWRFFMRAEAGQTEWSSESRRAGAVLSWNNSSRSNSSSHLLAGTSSYWSCQHARHSAKCLTCIISLKSQPSHELRAVLYLSCTDNHLKVMWPVRRSGTWTLIFWKPMFMPLTTAVHSLTKVHLVTALFCFPKSPPKQFWLSNLGSSDLNILFVYLFIFYEFWMRAK